MVPLSMQEVVRSAVTAVSETSLVWPYHIITSSHKVMQALVRQGSVNARKIMEKDAEKRGHIDLVADF